MAVNPDTGEVTDSPDFATFLATVRPKTNVELAEKLQRVVAAVRDTGKAGSVTLTIQIKPLADDQNVIQVFDQIKENLPEHDRKGSLAYPDKNNNLSRRDPNALVLFNTEDDIRQTPSAIQPTDIREAPKS